MSKPDVGAGRVRVARHPPCYHRRRHRGEALVPGGLRSSCRGAREGCNTAHPAIARHGAMRNSHLILRVKTRRVDAGVVLAAFDEMVRTRSWYDPFFFQLLSFAQCGKYSNARYSSERRPSGRKHGIRVIGALPNLVIIGAMKCGTTSLHAGAPKRMAEVVPHCNLIYLVSAILKVRNFWDLRISKSLVSGLGCRSCPPFLLA